MAFRLSPDVLATSTGCPGERHDPMSSAVTAASGETAKTACTINIHDAGAMSGYVAYGVDRVRSLQASLRQTLIRRSRFSLMHQRQKRLKLLKQDYYQAAAS